MAQARQLTSSAALKGKEVEGNRRWSASSREQRFVWAEGKL